MLNILKRKNQEVIRNAEVLEELVAKKSIPLELENYQDAILDIVSIIKTDAHKNLTDLDSLSEVDIQEEIVSDTQKVSVLIRYLSAIQTVPILRASSRDRIGLSILNWLHRQHPKTVHVPAAMSTNAWSILTLEDLPIYYLPSIEQQQLIQLPLLFHEFGHLLYAHHGPEMDDLVKELQQDINELLKPASRRNDKLSKRLTAKRQYIAFVWYSWIQELFCDAVGISIGGPAFLYAFSTYLGNLHRGDFHGTEEELKISKHPIKWLRVKFLVERSNEEGYGKIAREIAWKWDKIAQVLDITEDYFGYYDPTFDDVIRSTIKDMLLSAEPRKISQVETSGTQWSPKDDSPVRLLNWARQVYLSDPENYIQWEKKQITLFLESSIRK